MNHNQRYERSLETFSMTVNKFADISNAEFKHLYTGLKKRESKPEIQPVGITSKCYSEIDIIDDLP